MKRKLFLFCAVFSMLMCGAVAWWWTAHSPSKIDQVSYQAGPGDTLKLWGSNGKLMLTRTQRPVAEAGGFKQLSWGSSPCDAAGAAGAGANSKLASSMFAYAAEPLSDKPGGGTETTIVVPAWMLVAVFAVLPVMWAGSRLKGSKKKPSGA